MSASNVGRWSVAALLVAAGVVLVPALQAADAGKRTAPLYPGAVVIKEEGKKDCAKDTSTWAGAVCRQYTADPADKVKAFYDQKIGANRFLPDGPTYFNTMEGSLGERTPSASVSHFAPLAWHYTIGEAGIGDAFDGVVITEPRPPAWPAAALEARTLMSNSRFFGKLAGGVNWGAAGQPGTEGLRTPAQLKEVYAKYGYLEARYFTDPEALNRLKTKYEELEIQRKKAVEAKTQQAQKGAEAKQQGMMNQMGQAQKGGEKIMQGKDEQVNADRAEMDALMKKKPGLWAKAKPHYDRGNALMNEGMKDMNETKLNQAEVEMKKANDILRTDPEVAALQDKQMARADARAAGQSSKLMQSATAMQDAFAAIGPQAAKGNADAIWNTWTEYLAEAAKLSMYRTEIRVDFAPAGEGKDYSNKPETVASKWKAKKWEDPGAGKPGEDSGTAKSGGGSKPAATAASAGDKGKKEEKKSKTDDAKESAKKVGEEGVKLLKKLF